MGTVVKAQGLARIDKMSQSTRLLISDQSVENLNVEENVEFHSFLNVTR